jgi:hypothetical protein
MHYLGSALGFKTRKIPGVGKARALGGFDRLDPAAVHAFEKNAGSIRLFNQTNPAPVSGQARISVHELIQGQTQVGANGVDFSIRQADIPLPAATVPAPGALPESRHAISTTEGS